MLGDGDGDDDPFEDPFEEAGRSESSLGPDIPEVDVPEVEVPSVETNHDDFDADVDPELRRTFWRLVVVFDVALLALSLGPMFVYFRGDWETGGPLFALGAISFAYGVLTYRRYRADDDAGEPDAVGE
ncbi:DUF7322 domain-containing protein [Halosimplex pelagicum]|uniref:DUF7322 domain-containing protein n=1 Tax=Halosimplex pelagicum TaxID=869886 RepID=A0A7D5PDI1_9EURY|nr:hypothetical protein [Halosimplex pelagicum]QLH84505.1 hypothetical protein HZS54_23945 [Halosimplex pelagicum]